MILQLIFLLSFSQPDNCLEAFNNELGQQKATVLTEIVNLFENYLNNYEGEQLTDRYQTFLSSVAERNFQGYAIERTKKIETRRFIKSAGLDTAIFYYTPGFDSNGNERITTTKNVFSEYMNSLRAVSGCDILVAEYVDAIEVAGDIDPVLISDGALETFEDEDYNNPIIKRILVVELFIQQFLSDELED